MSGEEDKKTLLILNVVFAGNSTELTCALTSEFQVDAGTKTRSKSIDLNALPERICVLLARPHKSEI